MSLFGTIASGVKHVFGVAKADVEKVEIYVHARPGLEHFLKETATIIEAPAKAVFKDIVAAGTNPDGSLDASKIGAAAKNALPGLIQTVEGNLSSGSPVQFHSTWINIAVSLLWEGFAAAGYKL